MSFNPMLNYFVSLTIRVSFSLCIIVLMFFINPAAADPLSDNEKVSALIEFSGEIDIYTFTANVGDHIEIRMADTGIGSPLTVHFELFGPFGGSAIATGHSYIVGQIGLTLSETGTYRIEAQCAFGNTGPYDLYFTKVPGANEHGLLTNDSVQHGMFDMGDLDTYTFVANEGDHIKLRMADTSADGLLQPQIELYSSAGGDYIEMGGGSEHVGSLDYTVENTGTYTVLLKPTRNTSAHNYATGTYDLYFTKVPDANEHGAAPNGGVIHGELDLGDLDSYTFNANTGDHIKIRMADTSTGDELTVHFEVFGPLNGDAFTIGHSYKVGKVDFTVTETGTYTIVAENTYPSAAGNYDLYFVKIPGANEHGSLYNDDVVHGEINLGDLDTYTFFASADDNIEINMTNTSSNPGLMAAHFEVFGPSAGDALASGHSYTVGIVNFTATETGTYTIVAENAREYTGTYDLSFNSDGVVAKPVPAVKEGILILTMLLLVVLGINQSRRNEI